ARMMRAAGFGSVEVFGCFDGYNHQVGIAPLDDYQAWKAIRSMVDPPCSMLGTLRRLISDNRCTYRTLENEVVIFACKKPDAGRLFWSGLPAAGAVAQRNTGDKVSTLRFEDRRPTIFTKTAKDQETHGRIVREYEFLNRAQSLLGDEA